MFAYTICPRNMKNIANSQYLRSLKTVTQETASVIFVRKGGGAEILKKQSGWLTSWRAESMTVLHPESRTFSRHWKWSGGSIPATKEISLPALWVRIHVGNSCIILSQDYRSSEMSCSLRKVKLGAVRMKTHYFWTRELEFLPFNYTLLFTVLREFFEFYLFERILVTCE